MPPDWYDSHFRQSDDHQQPYYRSHYYFLWAVIADRIRRDGLVRVLEIGCGPGQLATLLFEQGVESYVGLDFSSSAIALARHNAPAGQFLIGDARTTTLHGEVEHDVVICTEVLEHIQDDLLALTRFRPGKRCMFSVPNFPYASHVRYFRDAGEVATRYGRFFYDLSVTTLKSPKSSPNAIDLFFLADGVRNERGVEPDVVAVRDGSG